MTAAVTRFNAALQRIGSLRLFFSLFGRRRKQIRQLANSHGVLAAAAAAQAYRLPRVLAGRTVLPAAETATMAMLSASLPRPRVSPGCICFEKEEQRQSKSHKGARERLQCVPAPMERLIHTYEARPSAHPPVYVIGWGGGQSQSDLRDGYSRSATAALIRWLASFVRSATPATWASC